MKISQLWRPSNGRSTFSYYVIYVICIHIRINSSSNFQMKNVNDALFLSCIYAKRKLSHHISSECQTQKKTLIKLNLCAYFLFIPLSSSIFVLCKWMVVWKLSSKFNFWVCPKFAMCIRNFCHVSIEQINRDVEQTETSKHLKSLANIHNQRRKWQHRHEKIGQKHTYTKPPSNQISTSLGTSYPKYLYR